jgi:RimJ/RimL family protein N-acetyltransferase
MSAALPHPAYRILTQRLHLRCWHPNDAQELGLAVTRNLEHLSPWMAWTDQEPESLERRVERLRRNRGSFDLGEDFTYGIFTPDSGHVIGSAALHTRSGEGSLEIGYWIDNSHTGKGLATEASAALTRVGFEVLEVQRIEIRCHPDNVASMRIPQKLAFTREGTLRSRYPWRTGEFQDQVVWSLLRSELPGSPAAQVSVQAFDALDRALI